MTEHVSRRIALRAVQVVIVAAGIFFLLLLVSRQAHAATLDDQPAPALITSSVTGSQASGSSASADAVTGPVGSVVGTVTTALGSATAPVTATDPGGSSSSGAAPSAPPPARRRSAVGSACSGALGAAHRDERDRAPPPILGLLRHPVAPPRHLQRPLRRPVPLAWCQGGRCDIRGNRYGRRCCG